ncbi:MAG: hypothetical protein JNK02_00440 [Planctomycetes bacterium]|nr:hypothetical protein [Planctomycetota bacterium]
MSAASTGCLARGSRVRRGALAVALLVTGGCLADTRIAPSWPGTTLLVAEDASATLCELEPNGGRVRHRYPLFADCAAIAAGRSGEYAAAIRATGEVAVLDLGRYGVDARYAVAGAGRASGLAFVDRLTRLAAAFDGAGDVLVFGRESGRIEHAIPTGAAGVVALAAGHRSGELVAAVTSPDELVWLDADLGRVVRRVALPGRPAALARGSEAGGTWAIVATDGGLRAWSERRGILEALSGPAALAVAAEAGTAVASDAASGAVLVWSAAGLTRIAVAEPDLTGAAWPIAVDPEGRNAFVALRSSGRVAAVDLREGRVRGAYAPLAAPARVAWSLRRELPEGGAALDGR